MVTTKEQVLEYIDALIEEGREEQERSAIESERDGFRIYAMITRTEAVSMRQLRDSLKVLRHVIEVYGRESIGEPGEESEPEEPSP